MEKELQKDKTKQTNSVIADIPQRKGWMDLLKNYIKDGKRPTKIKQEEETTKLFLDIWDEDKDKDEESEEDKNDKYFK